MINMYKKYRPEMELCKVINHRFACIFQGLAVMWVAPLDTRKSKCLLLVPSFKHSCKYNVESFVKSNVQLKSF